MRGIENKFRGTLAPPAGASSDDHLRHFNASSPSLIGRFSSSPTSDAPQIYSALPPPSDSEMCGASLLRMRKHVTARFNPPRMRK